MPSLAYQQPVTIADYLAGERESEQKYEYVDGNIYAMAGASLAHNLITGNCYGLLWNHLRGKPCYLVTTDMLLKTSENSFRYPDLMVVCENDPSTDAYVRENPLLIIEVLSNATRRKDKTEKRAEYLAIPSVLEYMLIEQDFAQVQLQRRRTNWQPEYYYLGESFYLESVNLDTKILDTKILAIYERVGITELNEFLQKKDSD